MVEVPEVALPLSRRVDVHFAPSTEGGHVHETIPDRDEPMEPGAVPEAPDEPNPDQTELEPEPAEPNPDQTEPAEEPAEPEPDADPSPEEAEAMTQGMGPGDDDTVD